MTPSTKILDLATLRLATSQTELCPDGYGTFLFCVCADCQSRTGFPWEGGNWISEKTWKYSHRKKTGAIEPRSRAFGKTVPRAGTTRAGMIRALTAKQATNETETGEDDSQDEDKSFAPHVESGGGGVNEQARDSGPQDESDSHTPASPLDHQDQNPASPSGASRRPPCGDDSEEDEDEDVPSAA
ncbi:uncharacterized protein JCM15063_002892 [Sporobolomyces koalae]|uniref:uncharacterized protein n=1 Tax=Sporobolomyces koalae TaxID=500713 RepID=UPI0031735DE8